MDLEAGLREEKRGLLSPLGMGAKKEGRSQQAACYRAGDGTRGSDMEEEFSTANLSDSLAYLLP